jgi:hypothetical protein
MRFTVRNDQPRRIIQTDVPVVLTIKCLDPVLNWFARAEWELSRTDNAGNPSGGFPMDNTPPLPLVYNPFTGELWVRSAVQNDIEVTIT